MSRPRHVALLALVLAAGLLPATSHAALPPRALAQRCLQALEAPPAPPAPRDDREALTVKRGGPDCAALLAAVRAPAEGAVDQGLVDALPEADAEALHDYLITLPADPAPAAQPAPDPQAVAAIVAALPDPERQPRSFWQRVDDWLRALLTPKPDAGAADNALSRLLRALFGAVSGGVGKALVWIVFVGILLSLAVVVIREVRAATRARPGPQPAAAIRGPMPPPAVTPAAGAMPEGPIALLRWVIDALVGSGQLPPDASLTNRELQARLQPAARSRFAAVARVAERALFGRIPAAAPELAAARDAAAALLKMPSSPP